MSGKLEVLMQYLQQWKNEKKNNKVLLFSQTKKVLNIIEGLLDRGIPKEVEDLLPGESPETKESIPWLRMDGDVSVSIRMNIIEKFNETKKD